MRLSLKCVTWYLTSKCYAGSSSGQRLYSRIVHSTSVLDFVTRQVTVTVTVQVVVGKKLDDVFMVMEFMEHDLKGLMEERDSTNPLFAMSEVRPLLPAPPCPKP